MNSSVTKVLKNNVRFIVFLEILQILCSGSCRKLYSIMNITFISCWIPWGWVLRIGEFCCSIVWAVAWKLSWVATISPKPGCCFLVDCACSKASCKKELLLQFVLHISDDSDAKPDIWATELAGAFALQCVNLGMWSWVRSAKMPVLC